MSEVLTLLLFCSILKELKAIRGATTVSEDSSNFIEEASSELMRLIIESNELLVEDIISILFSITPDLKSANPATAIRKSLGWTSTPMLCVQEAYIEGGLPRCIRALVHISSDKNKKLKHIYLNDAQTLRADWCQ